MIPTSKATAALFTKVRARSQAEKAEIASYGFKEMFLRDPQVKRQD
jgi:hypothetical protein